MSLAPCPKCSTNLKVPDGSVAAVRCPRCQTVFQPSAAAKPAIEVVDHPRPPAGPIPQAPPPPPSYRPPTPPSRPVSVSPPRKEPQPPTQEAEFEVVDDDPPPAKDSRPTRQVDEDRDRPRRTRDVADDEDRPRRQNRDDNPRRQNRDDDDRPKARKRRDDDDRLERRSSRRDDDEFEDRPRRRREDDEDDQPRARRRRYDDFDGEDDRGGRGRRRYEPEDYPRERRTDGFGPARIGALLLSISLWIYLGVFGVLALFVLVVWVGGNLPGVMMALAGLAGLCNWLVAAVGISFCLAGPKKSQGVTIATTVLCGVHLLLLLIMFGSAIDRTGFSSQGARGPGAFAYGGSTGAWMIFTSLIPVLEVLTPALIYSSGLLNSTEMLVAILAALCEVARLILVLTTLKSLAAAARDHDAAGKAAAGIKSVLAVCGGSAAIILIFAVVVHEAELTKIYNLGLILVLLVLLAHTCMFIMPSMAANETKYALARRARRR